MEKEIIWSKAAQNQLKKIYFFLLKQAKSNQVQNKVIDSIYQSVTILSTNWEIYELDEMKTSNNGDYRAYEIYSYRISYKITSTQIQILRIRHTSQNTKTL
ncbi:addiction module RelE/StbE family toxin [Flavobacterium araucananum]|jgi:addiction module RelE/StbE family toxin|uniref:Plasmid stabilization protein n=1 Tax=Flavobacterium araucananum TaxID=946678 RepID=A0A227PBV2_9FLAO|nr:type II toxin-antitoxin system RelE/ParE family toxin [Flavobacterium araucananum]OXG07411.1 plasmid stabilization protein [Flavobacterium araucananum]PWK00478.1 addiction module RelE/StbE family toxin [Flavobacterium araucananum]